MKYGQVNGIDKKISRLVQGTVYFGDGTQNEAFKVYDAVFEAGVNAFDTAHGYGQGGCERVLGEWIKSRGIRDDVVILGKGAHPYEGRNRVTPADITSDIHDSLGRMGVDYIDLYVLHRDDPSQPVSGIIDCLYEHHQAGRVHAIGGSNWAYERIAEANAYAETNNKLPFAVASPQFSVAEMVKPAWDGCISLGGDAAAQQWYADNGIKIFAWSSIAGGFMTGKYRRDNLDTFSEYFDMVTVNAYCYEDNFKRLDRTEALAEQKGVSSVQLSLAYVLNHPLEIFPLVGNRSIEEFTENVAAMELEITPEEMAWLNLESDVQPF